MLELFEDGRDLGASTEGVTGLEDSIGLVLFEIAGLSLITLLLDDGLTRGLLELFGRTEFGRDELTGLVVFGCDELGLDVSGRPE